MDILTILISLWRESIEASRFAWVFIVVGPLVLVLSPFLAWGDARNSGLGKGVRTLTHLFPMGVLGVAMSLSVGKTLFSYLLPFFIFWDSIHKTFYRAVTGWTFYRKPMAYCLGKAEVLCPSERKKSKVEFAISSSATLSLTLPRNNPDLYEEGVGSVGRRWEPGSKSHLKELGVTKTELYRTQWFFKTKRKFPAAYVQLSVDRYSKKNLDPLESPERYAQLLDCLATEALFRSPLIDGVRVPELKGARCSVEKGVPVVDIEVVDDCYDGSLVSYLPVDESSIVSLKFDIRTCEEAPSFSEMADFCRNIADCWSYVGASNYHCKPLGWWGSFEPTFTNHKKAELPRLECGEIIKLLRSRCKDEVEWVVFENASPFFYNWSRFQVRLYEESCKKHQKLYLRNFYKKRLAEIHKKELF